MGMQSHLTMGSRMSDYDSALRSFGALGLKST